MKKNTRERFVSNGNREEKPLCHVAMIAKFSNDNKPKMSNVNCTASNSFNLASVGEMFRGRIRKDHNYNYLSRKGKRPSAFVLC